MEQKRRVSIARALFSSPRLLLLDDIMAGLDTVAASQIMRELRQLVDATQISLIITVDRNSSRTLQMADKLLLLSGCSVCYFGTANRADVYFLSLGFERPKRVQELEWMLELTSRDLRKQDTSNKCIDCWESPTEALTLKAHLESLKVSSTIEPTESGYGDAREAFGIPCELSFEASACSIKGWLRGHERSHFRRLREAVDILRSPLWYT